MAIKQDLLARLKAILPWIRHEMRVTQTLHEHKHDHYVITACNTTSCMKRLM